MKNKYKFESLEELEDLADIQIAEDVLVKEQMKNGMPKELYVNSLIIQYFINRNLTNSESKKVREETKKLLEIAPAQCAVHYGKNADELKQAYERIANHEFLSQETIKNITCKLD